jgi:hypothetical protein
MDKYISHLHIIGWMDAIRFLFLFLRHLLFVFISRPYELWSKCESRFNFGVGLSEFL